LGFFGLKPESRAEIHKQIFQLIYFGKGFTHSDIYNMPTYLRRFYYNELNAIKKKENDEIKKSQQKTRAPRTPNIRNPRFK